MKIILLISILFLQGCGVFAKTPNKVYFHYTLKPLELNEYKNINIQLLNQQVCMPIEDYSNQILLLNKLSDYIEYQRTIIINMNDYYTTK